MASALEKRQDGYNKNEEMLRIPPLIEETCDFSYSQAVDSCATQESNDLEENDIPIETNSKDCDNATAETSDLEHCHLCDKTYKSKKTLASHLRLKHQTALKLRAKMPCLEKNCGFSGSRITSLVSHLIQAHGKKFQCEKVTFQSHDAFWKWKKQTEDTCRSSYSASTAAKVLAFGDKKIFFRCSRSGYSRSCGANEAKSSMKINAVCTSFMNANFLKEGGTAVFFCKTHYGHKDNNFYRYSRMTTFERNMMKGLLLEGLTASEIITFMKTQLPEHRHHLLKHSKVRNLAARDQLRLNKHKGSLGDKASPGEETSSPVHKSGDFFMDIKVENEVEIETGSEEPEGCNSSIDFKNDICPSLQSVDCNIVDKLQSDIVEKVQEISRLALGIVSQESLSTLNTNLDIMLKSIRANELIEVIVDKVGSNEDGQNSLTLQDNDGNLVHLLCSDKDVNELTK